MSEQKTVIEIEQLRAELAKVRADRDQLHKSLCQMLPVEEEDWKDEQVEQMLANGVSIVDLLQDPGNAEGKAARQFEDVLNPRAD